MPVNATLSNPSSVSGTTTTASSVAASTSVGVQPQITRMAIEGIRGADGDITWQGTWNSGTNYSINNAVHYNGSAYVALQGNTNVIPSSNTSIWSFMVSKGDTGATGTQGVTGETGAKGSIGDTGAQGPQGSSGQAGPQGNQGTQGPTGATGSAATISVGSVTTGNVGSSATVTNSGSSSAATLNFTIPTGADGADGSQGPAGNNGTAATISVGSTTTGNAGSSATVTNSGSSSSATFNFTIPKGTTGATGAQGATGSAGSNGAAGAAATIAVGTVSTGLPGSSASVTNAGSSSSATLNFAIPRGATGATGEITWKGGWSNSTVYGVNEAVYYNGSSYIALASNQNVTPGSDNTKWNIMAQAGAEGGSISSMSDTTISGSIADMAILAYDSNGTKWKDNNIFTGTFASPFLDGGTF